MMNYYFLRTRTFVFIIFFLVSNAFLNSGSFAQPVVSFTSFASGLSAPLDIVNAGDGTNRLFILQRNGTIRVHNGTSLLPTPFINIADTILDNGEQGLLSMAFHPDYETNRYFFVYYTDKEGDITLARYQTTLGDPNIADPNSEVVLLEIPKPGTPYFSNHNGGKIIFGSDGYLYVSIGDGGSGNDPFLLSQNGNSFFGKMLRLNVNNFLTPPYYSIPPDNPYVSNPAVLDEIWVLGLRNPWRWSFDRQTNDMWIGDVGQGAREEINFRASGSTGGINYGWRCYEGNNTNLTGGCGPSSNYVFPIFDYPHNGSTGGFSVTGGNVYRGPSYPLLTGYYICADYVSGNLWKIRPNGIGGWNIFQQNGLPGSIVGFGEAENGTLYAASLNGIVYLVEATTSLPVRLVNFNAQPKNESVLLEWQTSYEDQVASFEIEFSFNGIQFEKAGAVLPLNKPNGAQYRFSHFVSSSDKIYYRIKTVDQNGAFEYSKVLLINTGNNRWVRIRPGLVLNNTLAISASIPLGSIQLFTIEGKEVWRKVLGGQMGNLSLSIPKQRAGSYLVYIRSEGRTDIQRIVIQ